jgi:hypothetical protein
MVSLNVVVGGAVVRAMERVVLVMAWNDQDSTGEILS